jgi:quaternary ammonium compound-resistance protein SugE
MHWIFVMIAGCFEIGWAISLKKTQGFTQMIPMIFYAIFGLGSAFFLSQSMKVLPLAVAYGIWKGIALMGTTVADATLFKVPYTPIKIVSIIFILLGVFGLQYSVDLK